MEPPQKSQKQAANRPVATQERNEEEAFKNGPFSILHSAVHSGTKILVSCRNDKKLMGKVRAFDRHFNMILVGVYEAWSEQRPGKEPELKSRYIDKMFLRGDTVVLVTKVPE